MTPEEIFKLIGTFDGHIREREESRAAGEQIAPRVFAAIERGMRPVKELDPIVRDTLRDDPVALAERNDIMRGFDDLDGVAPPDNEVS